jgi:hypothetical protein
MDPVRALCLPPTHSPRVAILHAFRDWLGPFRQSHEDAEGPARAALRMLAEAVASPAQDGAVARLAQRLRAGYVQVWGDLDWGDGPCAGHKAAPAKKRLDSWHPSPEREVALALVARPAHRQDVRLQAPRQFRGRRRRPAPRRRQTRRRPSPRSTCSCSSPRSSRPRGRRAGSAAWRGASGSRAACRGIPAPPPRAAPGRSARPPRGSRGRRAPRPRIPPC